MTEESISEESAAAAEPAAKPSITLQDIASVVDILQVCTNRGAWRVNELTTVGQLYDRLTSFLEGAGVQLNSRTKTLE